MNDEMHSQHDLDLIAAFAEGRLTDSAKAEELVAVCQECSEIYRSHRLVLEAIAAEQAPAMGDLERRRLRSNVWDALQTEPAAAVSPSGVPWWYRAASVAALLVVVVGVGSMFVGGGGDGADSGTLELTSADAPTEAPTDDDGADEAAPEAFSAPATTAAADQAAEEMAEADGDASAAGEMRPNLTMDDLEEATTEFGERVAAGNPTIDESFDCPAPEDVAEPVFATETAQVEDAPVWFVAFGRSGEVSSVVIFRQADCTVVFASE